MMKIKNIKVQHLLSILILQFFFFQLIKLNIQSIESWYFPLLLKFKFFLNSITSIFPFSIGDILYILIGIVILSWSIFCLYFLFKKNKQKAFCFLTYIALTINILYAIFMLSFGTLYEVKNFSEYNNTSQKLYLNDLKIVSQYLLNDCIMLREKVPVNNKGEFIVNSQQMMDKLYWEQSTFYSVNKQKPNLKPSIFSFIMKKIGITGYYNPFTGEAQIVKGIPDTSIPFTIAHEMGHQAGIAKENEANFYSFYMGESSPNISYQYSVKYKALQYVLSEIYPNDSMFVKNIINQYSMGMKRDRERDKLFYKNMYGLGADTFSFMNNVYLKSNTDEGVIAYNKVTKMIVYFYKLNYPEVFNEKKQNIFYNNSIK